MKNQTIENNGWAKVAFVSIILLILAAGFVLSMPYFCSVAKDVRKWGISGMEEAISEFEERYNAEFPMRTGFINLNGIMARALQKRELNEVYKLKNGYLGVSVEQAELEWRAERVAQLNRYLSENGIEMSYVEIPSKESMPDAFLPDGIMDYSKQNAENMLGLLRGRDIDVLDLRKLISDNMTMEEAFFRTDHHWKPETAFWAAGQMMAYLNQRYGVIYDAALCDLSNYHVDIYPNYFLGSRGKRTGAWYAGVDDFTVIHPKFETHMTTFFPSGNVERTGTFLDANIDFDYLVPKDWFGKIAYCTYVGGDFPVVVHTNAPALTDKRILVLKDSFSLPLQTFLSVHFPRIDVLDLRHYKNERLIDYIMRAKPDIVLLCYAISAFNSNNEALFAFGIDER